MKLNQLTPEEENILIYKGTEAPYSGEYENFSANGIYICRQCNAYLYRSEDKFDAHCGWPSFQDEILGGVSRKTDDDGERTEITCTRCNAHLGHIFIGEKMTAKDTRHCVNSLSLKFIPTSEMNDKIEAAYFGGGCFWCLEAFFKEIKGIISVIPGYSGGKTENPTYEEVCKGSTGHAEIVKIKYDPTVISYEALLEILFNVHNPTTLNRQGNDIGTQYRSIILCEDDQEKEIVENFIKKMETENIYSDPIVTEVGILKDFYQAEEYHHDYFKKNPSQAYCQLVISPKVNKLRKNFEKYLK